mmetsp:Transcript_2498/g.7371  ORF Transcript_2498/g.7371 Transcript_2498/m.7371 type:complete len:310 (+) Transcript_2498:1435-2364(+)
MDAHVHHDANEEQEQHEDSVGAVLMLKAQLVVQAHNHVHEIVHLLFGGPVTVAPIQFQDGSNWFFEVFHWLHLAVYILHLWARVCGVVVHAEEEAEQPQAHVEAIQHRPHRQVPPHDLLLVGGHVGQLPVNSLSLPCTQEGGDERKHQVQAGDREHREIDDIPGVAHGLLHLYEGHHVRPAANPAHSLIFKSHRQNSARLQAGREEQVDEHHFGRLQVQPVPSLNNVLAVNHRHREHVQELGVPVVTVDEQSLGVEVTSLLVHGFGAVDAAETAVHDVAVIAALVRAVAPPLDLTHEVRLQRVRQTGRE